MANNTTIWNDLIALRDKTKDNSIKQMCSMYLGQLNTASGIRVRQEAINWFNSIQ